MTQHAKFSPSQLPRIIKCPGSVSVQTPQPSSSYAEEGTLCHDIVAKHLEKDIYKLDTNYLRSFPVEDRPELGDAIQDCLDFAFTLISKYDRTKVLIETQVSLAGFAEDLDCLHLEDVYGTADLVVISFIDKVIHVVDWKFGKGIEVFPTSDQLKAYGLGALSSGFSLKRFDKVVLHVGQPRLYMGEKFKQLEIHPRDLYEWAELDLVPALTDAMSSSPTFRPSEDACRWCSIKATCAARYNLAMQTAQDVFRIHAEVPHIKSDIDLASFLGQTRNLAAYIKDIEAHLAHTIMNGKPIPGLKMVEGRSIRKWVDEKQFVKWATEYHPDADIFETKPLSPSKAEKLFKRKIASTDEFQALIEKPPGKATLVTDDDPRPPIKFESATEVFADYVEEDI